MTVIDPRIAGAAALVAAQARRMDVLERSDSAARVARRANMDHEGESPVNRPDAGLSAEELRREADRAEAAFDQAAREYRNAEAAARRSKSQKNLAALEAADAAFHAALRRHRRAQDAWERQYKAEEKATNKRATAGPTQGELF